jgi:hypothetical protein
MEAILARRTIKPFQGAVSQINLRHYYITTGNDRFWCRTQSKQAQNIFICSGVVFCALIQIIKVIDSRSGPRMRQRCDFNLIGVRIDALHFGIEAKQIIKAHVKRPQNKGFTQVIDHRVKTSGVGLYRGPHQQNCFT